MPLEIVPHEADTLPNFDVLQRLAEAWNPPDTVGKVYLKEGVKEDTLHICFSGHYDGQEITVMGTALDREIFCVPEHRKTLARDIRDYFATALPLHSSGGG